MAFIFRIFLFRREWMQSIAMTHKIKKNTKLLGKNVFIILNVQTKMKAKYVKNDCHTSIAQMKFISAKKTCPFICYSSMRAYRNTREKRKTQSLDGWIFHTKIPSSRVPLCLTFNRSLDQFLDILIETTKTMIFNNQ